MTTDPDAELRRTAGITCDQDRGENPLSWSEPDDLPPLPTPGEICESVHATDQEEEACERRRLQETPPARPFRELRDAGLLWLINHQILHPRGVALALHFDDAGDATGWNLLASPDGKPWTFTAETNDDGRARAEDTLTAAGALPAHPGLELPPFSGALAVCAKCGHDLVSTRYQPPLSAHALLKTKGRFLRGPLPERQRRECEGCGYTWLEAVAGQESSSREP